MLANFIIRIWRKEWPFFGPYVSRKQSYEGQAGRSTETFQAFPNPGSTGVNVFDQDLRDCDGVKVNAYVFPPFGLIFPLLRLFLSQEVVATLVVPKLSPLPLWWPVLKSMTQKMFFLARKGCTDALLFPSKDGFK